MDTERLGRCSRASLDYIRMSLKYNEEKKKRNRTHIDFNDHQHHPVSFMTKSHGGKKLEVFLCLIIFSIIVMKYSISC